MEHKNQQHALHKNPRNRISHCNYLLLKPDVCLFFEVLCDVIFIWLLFLLILFPFPFLSTPQNLIPLKCFPIPFPLLICCALAQAIYSAFFSSLNLSELIIKYFNLSCMTCNHVRGFLANTIPSVKSVRFPAFPCNNNDS